MTEFRPIRIAQIGIGHNHASAIMETLRAHPEFFDVVAVAETSREWFQRRADLPAYEGLTWRSPEEILADPEIEAVAVETDGPQTAATAETVITAGKHMHLDKPGGEAYSAFERMIESARRQQLIVQLGYMYRNNPAVQLCFRAVREGWLGRVFEAHAVMNRWDDDDYRRWIGQFGGGAMYIFGSHLVDLIVYLFGEPSRITPFLRQTRQDGVVDSGFAVLEYETVVASVRSAISEVGGRERRQLTVVGDRGTVEIRPLEPHRLRLTLAEPHGGYESGTHEVDLPEPSGRYDDQLTEFARAIRGEIENPFSLAHELLTQRTMLLAAGYLIEGEA